MVLVVVPVAVLTVPAAVLLLEVLGVARLPVDPEAPGVRADLEALAGSARHRRH